MIPSEPITSSQTEGALNKKDIIRLADEERRPLAELTRNGNAPADTIRHANLLLKAEADGPAWTDERIAERFSVSVNTVLGVRQRAVAQGLDAARNRQKQAPPARSPRWDGAGEARLIARRGSAPPAGHARWTLRLLADQAVAWESVEAMRHETVRQVRKKRR
jgi:hypothetical protein